MKSFGTYNLGGSSFAYFDQKFASEKLIYYSDLDSSHELKSTLLSSLDIPEWYDFLEKNKDELKSLIFQISLNNYTRTHAFTSKMGLLDNSRIDYHKQILRLQKDHFIGALKQQSKKVCYFMFLLISIETYHR